MRDVVVLAIIVAFFAVCVAYVWLCDRIIGPDVDSAVDVDTDVPATTETVDAPAVADVVAP